MRQHLLTYADKKQAGQRALTPAAHHDQVTFSHVGHKQRGVSRRPLQHLKDYLNISLANRSRPRLGRFSGGGGPSSIGFNYRMTEMQ